MEREMTAAAASRAAARLGAHCEERFPGAELHGFECNPLPHRPYTRSFTGWVSLGKPLSLSSVPLLHLCNGNSNRSSRFLSRVVLRLELVTTPKALCAGGWHTVGTVLNVSRFYQ